MALTVNRRDGSTIRVDRKQESEKRKLQKLGVLDKDGKYAGNRTEDQPQNSGNQQLQTAQATVRQLNESAQRSGSNVRYNLVERDGQVVIEKVDTTARFNPAPNQSQRSGYDAPDSVRRAAEADQRMFGKTIQERQLEREAKIQQTVESKIPFAKKEGNAGQRTVYALGSFIPKTVDFAQTAGESALFLARTSKDQAGRKAIVGELESQYRTGAIKETALAGLESVSPITRTGGFNPEGAVNIALTGAAVSQPRTVKTVVVEQGRKSPKTNPLAVTRESEAIAQREVKAKNPSTQSTEAFISSLSKEVNAKVTQTSPKNLPQLLPEQKATVTTNIQVQKSFEVPGRAGRSKRVTRRNNVSVEQPVPPSRLGEFLGRTKNNAEPSRLVLDKRGERVPESVLLRQSVDDRVVARRFRGSQGKSEPSYNNLRTFDKEIYEARVPQGYEVFTDSNSVTRIRRTASRQEELNLQRRLRFNQAVTEVQPKPASRGLFNDKSGSLRYILKQEKKPSPTKVLDREYGRTIFKAKTRRGIGEDGFGSRARSGAEFPSLADASFSLTPVVGASLIKSGNRLPFVAQDVKSDTASAQKSSSALRSFLDTSSRPVSNTAVGLYFGSKLSGGSLTSGFDFASPNNPVTTPSSPSRSRKEFSKFFRGGEGGGGGGSRGYGRGGRRDPKYVPSLVGVDVFQRTGKTGKASDSKAFGGTEVRFVTKKSGVKL